VQFRCSTVSSGAKLCASSYMVYFDCSCTRASLDQTITRTNAYTHGRMRVALRWTSAHACGPMHAGEWRLRFLCEVHIHRGFHSPLFYWARRYYPIRLFVYLEFSELLFLVNWTAVDCSWRDRTMPLKPSAVAFDVHSIWNFMVLSCRKNLSRNSC